MEEVGKEKSLEEVLAGFKNDPASKREIFWVMVLFFVLKNVFSLTGTFMISLLIQGFWAWICIEIIGAPIYTSFIFLALHMGLYYFFLKPAHEKEMSSVVCEARAIHAVLLHRWKTKDYSV